MTNSDQTLLVLMLEDDAERLLRFASLIADKHPQVTFLHWRTAPAFIGGYQSLRIKPHLISLDHDLFVEEPDEPDPGDGRDVAKFLAEQEPICPILIHSSNSIAADSMQFTLEESGWKVRKIAPLGEDWIESYWYSIAKRWLGPKK